MCKRLREFADLANKGVSGDTREDLGVKSARHLLVLCAPVAITSGFCLPPMRRPIRCR